MYPTGCMINMTTKTTTWMLVAMFALMAVAVTPSASASCPVNAGPGAECNGGNCKVNIMAKCEHYGSCTVNVLASCNVRANCAVNVVASCQALGYVLT
jgi:hypothetical protein